MPWKREAMVAVSLEQLLAEYGQKWNVPGVGVAVFSDREILEIAAVGTASLEPPHPALTPGTLHRLHSVTKMLTCTAVLALAESGALSLTDRAQSFISPAHDAPDLDTITVRQLLTHTSGLGRGLHTDSAHQDWGGELGQGALDYVGRTGSLSEPGRVYDYSNAGIALLGYIVEQVTGQPFPRAMRETLFEPAGMATACFDPRQAMSFPLSQQHVRDRSGWHVRHFFNYSSSFRPFAGAYCSVTDLARFGMWQLSRTVRAPRMSAFGQVPHPQADLGLDIGLNYGLGCYTGPRYGTTTAYGQIGYQDGSWAGITLLTRPALGVAWCDNVGLDEVPISARQEIIEHLLTQRGAGQRTWTPADPPPGPPAEENQLTGVYRRPTGLPVIVESRAGKLIVGDGRHRFELHRLRGLTFVADAQEYFGTLPWRPHDHSSQCCVSFAAPGHENPHHLLINGTPYLRTGECAGDQGRP